MMNHKIKQLNRLFGVFIIGLALITAIPAIASDVKVKSDSVVKEITIKITTIDESNHINWSVKGQNDQDLFVVQRAVDWEGFKTLEFVSGFSVSASIAVPHTYIDKNPPEGNVRYKIQNFRNDKIVMSSDIVKANKP